MSSGSKRKNEEVDDSKNKKSKKPVVKSGNDTPSESAGIVLTFRDKSNALVFSRDRRTVTCTKGYRTLKGSVSVDSGIWYCEFVMGQELKVGAQARVGWVTESFEPNAPVGYDQFGYGYRGENGSRVHQSVLNYYGKPFKGGDVVGCMINFNTSPEELRAAERRDNGASSGPMDCVRQLRADHAVSQGCSISVVESILLSKRPPEVPPWDPNYIPLHRISEYSSSFATPPPIPPPDLQNPSSLLEPFVYPEEAPAGPVEAAELPSARGGRRAGGSHSSRPSDPISQYTSRPTPSKKRVDDRLWGSSVRFFLNGEDQGIAFIHLTQSESGRFWPAVSLFGGASARLNAGPEFEFPPPYVLDGVPCDWSPLSAAPLDGGDSIVPALRLPKQLDFTSAIPRDLALEGEAIALLAAPVENLESVHFDFSGTKFEHQSNLHANKKKARK